jgi:riboflavin synthase
MFTGIIEEVGSVAMMESREAGARIRIACRQVLSDAFEGASISVNGVCLTALDLKADSFAADLAPETLRLTSLGSLQPGSRVNLERPMAINGRFGGHIVQGHVDGTGEVLALDHLGDGNWWLRLRLPENLERYLVHKGSICIDGISLTIAALKGYELAVTIIPHTIDATNLGDRKPGDLVNLECDVVAKYVEKMLPGSTSGI